MKKSVIETRKHSNLISAIEDLENVYAAGFSADLIGIGPEPAGSGINLGNYYAVTIYKWVKESE